MNLNSIFTQGKYAHFAFFEFFVQGKLTVPIKNTRKS